VSGKSEKRMNRKIKKIFDKKSGKIYKQIYDELFELPFLSRIRFGFALILNRPNKERKI